MTDRLLDFLMAVFTRSDLWLVAGLLLAWLVARRLVRGTGVSAHQIDGLAGCCLVTVFVLLLTVTLVRDGASTARPWTYWLSPRGDVAVAFVALMATTVLYARVRRIPCATLADAGTPGVSDPGARTVAAVRAAGFKVIPLPGPNAAIAAMSARAPKSVRSAGVKGRPSRTTQSSPRIPSGPRRGRAAHARASSLTTSGQAGFLGCWTGVSPWAMRQMLPSSAIARRSRRVIGAG